MDLDSLAKLGEFVGGFFVVLSLVYLAHQVRMNTKSLRSENVWPRWEATIGWWLSHPGIRAWWASKPTPLTADFEAFGDELIRNDRFDASAIDRWRRFVSGECPSSAPASTTATVLE